MTVDPSNPHDSLVKQLLAGRLLAHDNRHAAIVQEQSREHSPTKASEPAG
jgi:hypothetical protein